MPLFECPFSVIGKLVETIVSPIVLDVTLKNTMNKNLIGVEMQW